MPGRELGPFSNWAHNVLIVIKMCMKAGWMHHIIPGKTVRFVIPQTGGLRLLLIIWSPVLLYKASISRSPVPNATFLTRRNGISLSQALNRRVIRAMRRFMGANSRRMASPHVTVVIARKDGHPVFLIMIRPGLCSMEHIGRWPVKNVIKPKPWTKNKLSFTGGKSLNVQIVTNKRNQLKDRIVLNNRISKSGVK